MTAENEVFDLAEVVAEARAEHGDIIIRTFDGKEYAVPPPQLWSDKAADPKVGPAETAIEVMGAENYKAFCDSGGSASRLNLVIAAWAKRRDIDLGK